ncbi:ParB/RepB/Spo0J family partition protein [Salmonella enterica]
MSVANVKAKAAKKATPKKNAVSAGLKAALDAAVIQYAPLSSLIKSPLNVRTIPYTADSVKRLANSIEALGLLHNLVVHALPDGQSGVAAGGRRLAALTLLCDAGRISPDYPVPVKCVTDELAVEASYAENKEQEAMHPAEQISSFGTLAAQGKTVAQIGDGLGYGSRHVQRMLKLASLAPALLEKLAQDEITTEHCQALALESDPARQLQVYEAACQRGWNNKPEVSTIRSLITDAETSTRNNPRFRFVGEAAFSPDDVRLDLFSDEQGGYVNTLALDAALLEKLQIVAEGLREAEGWSWCAGQMESISYYGENARRYDILTQPKVVLSADEQQFLDEADGLSDGDSYPEAEISAIACAAEVRAWKPEQRAAAGVVVSWNGRDVQVQRGVVLRQEQESDTSDVVTHRPPEVAEGISTPMLTKLSSERTLAVQAALLRTPQKTLALLAWKLCASVFGGYSVAKHPFSLSVTTAHSTLTSTAPSGEEGKAYQALQAEKARLAALLPPGWEKDFTTFFALDDQTLLSLMTFCTVCSVDGVQKRDDLNRKTASPLDGVETAIGFHLRDWWQPTAAGFFTFMTKPQIVTALNEAGMTEAAVHAEKLKKGDAAQYAAEQMADTRWVPDWMTAPEAVTPEVPADHNLHLADAA